MPATIAGFFEEVNCQHSRAGNRKFDLKSGEDSELDRGGYRIADDENNRTASGKLILQYENKMPYIQFTCVVVAETEDYIQDLIKDSVSEIANWTLTHVSGDIYTGNGVIVGDVKPNRNAGTVQIKVAFEDELLNIS
jgi:hypothetical protein